MDKRSPKGRKRSSKGSGSVSGGGAGGSSEENFWDCSVCTFRNHAEAFKCSMCDVRKGTSTRKPRINPDLAAAQHAQALTPPPLSSTPTPSSSATPTTFRDDEDEEDEDEEPEVRTPSGPAPKIVKKSKEKKVKVPKEPKEKKSPAANRARLKNVDRSSATYHSVTVNDVTVVITEFKPKVKKEKKPPKPGSKAALAALAASAAALATSAGGDGDKAKKEDTSNQENVARNITDSVTGARSS